jgi:hypothetical protein
MTRRAVVQLRRGHNGTAHVGENRTRGYRPKEMADERVDIATRWGRCVTVSWIARVRLHFCANILKRWKFGLF